MHQHYGSGTWGNSLLNKAIVYLESIPSRFYKHWLKTVFGNGKYGSHKGVGRHNNLVAFLHHSHLLVCTQDKGKGIKPIATAYAIACADILGKLMAEVVVGGTLQIPSTIDNICHGLVDIFLMQCRDIL